MICAILSSNALTNINIFFFSSLFSSLYFIEWCVQWKEELRVSLSGDNKLEFHDICNKCIRKRIILRCYVMQMYSSFKLIFAAVIQTYLLFVLFHSEIILFLLFCKFQTIIIFCKRNNEKLAIWIFVIVEEELKFVLNLIAL